MLIVPFIWLGQEPAIACSCVVRTTPELVASADAVVTGRLQDSESARGGMDIVYTFMGLERFKGDDLTPGFEVRSASMGASCGLEGLQAGRTYVVFMDSEAGGFSANLCGGTRRATSEYVARVEASTGPGTSFDLPPPATEPPEDSVALAVRPLSSIDWWG
jgi:hypothetical protein